MTSTQYEIQGRTVSIPVEVRSARSWFASFAVPFAAARDLIAYSGLVPASPLPGRAFASLAFVDYADGDLDPYHEFAVAILVCEPGTTGRKPAGAFIHQLPVDQSFTCEAGREMWGFPKFIADIDIQSGARGAGSCTLVHDGTRVLSLRVAVGVPVPSRGTALDAFSCREGVVRRTRWSLHGEGSRLRLGGARLELGDHPIAQELRRLGLPRRALMSGSLHDVRMEFAAAETV
jgi:Acetoacetate decarboxylase (ADC)